MALEFKDYSIEVKEAINEAAIAYLHEAAGELEAQVKRNTPVDTGQLKGSWNYKVYEHKAEAVIGSPLENAIWNEFGTGEFAAKNNGRKGGWKYKDRKGNWHFTKGKRPQRTFQNAYDGLKEALKRRAAEVFKAKMK